jgi:curli production assembly/transport component CsgG
MMRALNPALLLASLFVAGCFPVPELRTTPPMVDQQSAFETLSSLAPPKGEPIVVGVYNFLDQSGQRLVNDRPVSEMSTALPQGLSSILVQELQRAADGKLYRVVERENVDALLTERRIVVASLPEEQASQLTPLLLPGIILTGGAVSYDRSVTQDLRGLGFKSVNGVKEVATDQVGIILRAVSVKNGEVLATVHARKSVMSARSGISGLYILNNDVLALEVGGSANEPISLAVRLAIAAAVLELTHEGIKKGWWTS